MRFRVGFPAVNDAFFEPDGDRWVPTAHTRGPWDPDAQHAGPPAALIGRALERCEPRPGFRIARVTLDILRAVPLRPLRLHARVVRPGRSVELLEAAMCLEDDTEIVNASAWRIVTADTTSVARDADGGAPPGPETGDEPLFLSDRAKEFGYGHAMEWRFVRGSFLEPGPACAWLRMRLPLVPGEEPTPTQRVLIAADSGNGISAALDPSTHWFINTELTVHLLRDLEGEWVNLDAVTRIGGNGIGIAETVLRDRRGRLGRGTQALLVAPRG